MHTMLHAMVPPTLLISVKVASQAFHQRSDQVFSVGSVRISKYHQSSEILSKLRMNEQKNSIGGSIYVSQSICRVIGIFLRDYNKSSLISEMLHIVLYSCKAVASMRLEKEVHEATFNPMDQKEVAVIGNNEATVFQLDERNEDYKPLFSFHPKVRIQHWTYCT